LIVKKYIAETPQGFMTFGVFSLIIVGALDIVFDVVLKNSQGLMRVGLFIFGVGSAMSISRDFFGLHLRSATLHNSSLRFVPQQFLEYLGVNDITRLRLGDSIQKELTVLFFDIRSFSIHSEMMSAKENFNFINRVLGAAGPVLRRHNGFVDKYLGDAAMALFSDAADAVRAGIELYRSLILDETTRITIQGDPINIGIGVHSGSVMLGIVGEEERLSSTVISRTVNLASRLESLTKEYHSPVIINDRLYQAVNKDEFNLRYIDRIRVKGKNIPVDIYEEYSSNNEKIIALRKESEKRIRELQDMYFSGKNLDDAIRLARELIDYNEQYVITHDLGPAHIGDWLPVIYLERMEYLRDNPGLMENWDGVFTFYH